MIKHLLLFTFLFVLSQSISAQERFGINTATPTRVLEVSGSSDQFIRVQSNTYIGTAGLELMRGTNNVASRDWRILNENSVLKIATSSDEFSSASEVLRISSTDNMGIGTTSPATRLHLDGNSPLSLGGNGLLKIGTPSLDHLAFDNFQIQAWNNNTHSPLYLQPTGGNTEFGVNGGHTFMNLGGGRVGVGTVTLDAALNIDDPSFQMYLRNDTDGDVNDWYIGASNSTWAAGDRQLLFSPTSSSNDAALRLLDVDENDGTEAPVMIYTTYDQTLLLDGNEIDTRGAPLYINHNSDEHTLINPSGGRVGIGTTNPQAMLHVVTSSSNAMTLQHDNSVWHLEPLTTGNENLAFTYGNNVVAFAEIDGLTGHWNPYSDKRAKKDILPLRSVMQDLKKLNSYTYDFKHDTTGRRYIGILAQEALPLFPEIVELNEDQYGVAYGELAVIGLRAIQEQQILIDSLKEKLALLKNLKKEGAIEAGKVTVD